MISINNNMIASYLFKQLAFVVRNIIIVSKKIASKPHELFQKKKSIIIIMSNIISSHVSKIKISQYFQTSSGGLTANIDVGQYLQSMTITADEPISDGYIIFSSSTRNGLFYLFHTKIYRKICSSA